MYRTVTNSPEVSFRGWLPHIFSPCHHPSSLPSLVNQTPPTYLPAIYLWHDAWIYRSHPHKGSTGGICHWLDLLSWSRVIISNERMVTATQHPMGLPFRVKLNLIHEYIVCNAKSSSFSLHISSKSSAPPPPPPISSMFQVQLSVVEQP